jgi:hypothetical protein
MTHLYVRREDDEIGPRLALRSREQSGEQLNDREEPQPNALEEGNERRRNEAADLPAAAGPAGRVV